jgi:hypothetical protein
MARKLRHRLREKLQRLARKLPFLGPLLVAADLQNQRLDHLHGVLAGLVNQQAFVAREQLRMASPRCADPLRLCAHEASVNSQNGEDGILAEIFSRIGATDRVFVEIGVGDGLENNSAFLLAQGWRGYWVDGNEGFLPVAQRAVSGRADRLRWHVGFVDRENIFPILAELGVPEEFDLLSLDIDQNTYHVWEGLRSLRPRVVAIEYNAAIPASVDWKVNYSADRAWIGGQNYGASLKALEHLGTSLGYCLVGCDFNGVNAFFVRSDLVEGHFAAPFTAENHYEPSRHLLVHQAVHWRDLLDMPD